MQQQGAPIQANHYGGHMPVRKRQVYKVESGGKSRWFWDEHDARKYASDRFDRELDGVPFITELTDAELMVRVNELEAMEQ
jgi:hypothetical protein